MCVGLRRAAPPRGDGRCRRRGRLLAQEIAVGDGVVVAVGECGLDYYYEHSPRTCSARHSPNRSHWHTPRARVSDSRPRRVGRSLRCLGRRGVPERTILHCFTGGPDELERCVRSGMFVSFSGIITFKSASDIREQRALPARPVVGGDRQPVSCARAAPGARQRTGAVAVGRGDRGRGEGMRRRGDRRQHGRGGRPAFAIPA